MGAQSRVMGSASHKVSGEWASLDRVISGGPLEKGGTLRVRDPSPHGERGGARLLKVERCFRICCFLSHRPLFFGVLVMAASTIATTTTLAGEQSATLRANMKSSSNPAPEKHEDQDDQFFWSYTEEPHRSRRMAIIKAHPEVLKLCGPEPLTIPLVLAVVALQCTCAYLLSNTPFWSWRFWLTAYVIGATANQNLFLAIHEISHNLAFKSGLANRLLAIVANLPIGIPYSASFRVCNFRTLLYVTSH